jgi:hypothetical protein
VYSYEELVCWYIFGDGDSVYAESTAGERGIDGRGRRGGVDDLLRHFGGIFEDGRREKCCAAEEGGEVKVYICIGDVPY